MAQVERATSVGGKQYLTQTSTLMQYESNLTPLGYYTLSYEGTNIQNTEITFYVSVPNDYVIQSAKITLNFYVSNIYYTLADTSQTNVLGKATNIHLYKSANSEYAFSDNFGTFEITAGSLTEIPGAFGVSGYTNSTSAATTIESLDITPFLSYGLNILKIKNPTALVGMTDAKILEAAQKTQLAVAILNIIGYTK